MNHHDRPGSIGKVLFDKPLIDIQGVFPDIHKGRPGLMQDEGIGGGYEGIGREQDFISFLKIKENGGHLQGVGAGGGQQYPGGLQKVFQKAMAFPGILTVSGNMAPLDSIGDINKLVSGQGGLVEGNHTSRQI